MRQNVARQNVAHGGMSPAQKMSPIYNIVGIHFGVRFT
jgi:hypothetical protein